MALTREQALDKIQELQDYIKKLDKELHIPIQEANFCITPTLVIDLGKPTYALPKKIILKWSGGISQKEYIPKTVS